MLDKDGLFLDEIENMTHEWFGDGDITNTMRSKMMDIIQELRDWL